jgi:uncharacterized protein with FMN-binding domain
MVSGFPEPDARTRTGALSAPPARRPPAGGRLLRRAGAAAVAGAAVTLAVEALLPGGHRAAPTRPAARPTDPVHQLVVQVAGPSRWVLGAPVDIGYGVVQVRAQVGDRRLLDVAAVRLPMADENSRRLSGASAPALRAQALARQGGPLDAVSGASYTAEAYARSLQAALDVALHGGTAAPQVL